MQHKKYYAAWGRDNPFRLKWMRDLYVWWKSLRQKDQSLTSPQTKEK